MSGDELTVEENKSVQPCTEHRAPQILDGNHREVDVPLKSVLRKICVGTKAECHKQTCSGFTSILLEEFHGEGMGLK